jgi:hypothetical protein
MGSINRVGFGLAALSVLSMCLPTAALAQGSAPPAPAVTDVALGPGNILSGQLMDSHGVPLANVLVSLQDDQGREVAHVTTDEQGRFAVQGVRGGVHQIVTPQGRWFYRLWTTETAPPSAQQGALMVSGDETVRGAAPHSGLKFWYTNPLVVGGVVATAIAVPVALTASQHHRPASN